MTSLLLATALLPTTFAAEPVEAPAALPVILPALQAYQIDTTSPTHSDYYAQVGFSLVTTRSSDGPDEEIDFDEGYAVPILIGKRFDVSDGDQLGFALELEGIYSDQEAEDDELFTAVRDVTGINVLVNGVFDYAINEHFGLYGGAGVGLGWLDIGTEDDGLSSFDDEDGPFLSWQLKAGLLYQASDTIGIDIGYRFLNTDDAELDDSNGDAQFDLQTRQHMLGVGFRFDL